MVHLYIGLVLGKWVKESRGLDKIDKIEKIKWLNYTVQLFILLT